MDGGAGEWGWAGSVRGVRMLPGEALVGVAYPLLVVVCGLRFFNYISFVLNCVRCVVAWRCIFLLT